MRQQVSLPSDDDFGGVSTEAIFEIGISVFGRVERNTKSDGD